MLFQIFHANQDGCPPVMQNQRSATEDPTSPPEAQIDQTVSFRLSMAARRGITKVSQNIEFTYEWEIENFDLAMAVGEKKLKSSSFCIPGVQGEFHMVVGKIMKPYPHQNHTKPIPDRVKVGDQELVPKFYFSVSLKSTVEGTKAAGKLEVIKEGAKTLTGEFGDPAKSNFVFPCYFRPTRALEIEYNAHYMGDTVRRPLKEAFLASKIVILDYFSRELPF